jgi:hypothetical protein
MVLNFLTLKFKDKVTESKYFSHQMDLLNGKVTHAIIALIIFNLFRAIRSGTHTGDDSELA